MFSPSLICFDMCNLEQQIRELEAAGASMLHVDILDGHFSPSMPLGLEAVKQLRKKTVLPFDAHLMATENDYFINELLDIGVQQLVFHVETVPHVDEMLNRIKGRGVRAGVALKPATPLSAVEYVLEKCDVVLLMLINPGYASSAGERQVAYADRKIRDLRAMIDRLGLDTRIEIDGRISPQNIVDYQGIVDIFVAGTTCVRQNAIQESFQKLHALRQSSKEGTE